MAPRSRCHNRFRVSGPLADVRVLAVEQYGAGPWGTMQLADLGAEVIKVEDPSVGGDVGRYVPPYQEGESSLFFETFNRDKRSVSLDLRNAGVARRVRGPRRGRWTPCSRTFAATSRTSSASASTTWRQVNPRIVCCSLSGFGMTGPRAAEGAYDYTLQGLAGWQSVTGDPDGPPTKSGLSLVDFCGGYVAALAILAGVWRARRDGRGADVDLSLFEAALAQLTYLGTWVASRGYEPVAARELCAPVDGPVPELRDRRRLDRHRLPEAGAVGAALLGARARRIWPPRRARSRRSRDRDRNRAELSYRARGGLRARARRTSGSRRCRPRASRARRSTTSRQRSKTRRRSRARGGRRDRPPGSRHRARGRRARFRFDGYAPRATRGPCRGEHTAARAARPLRLLRRPDRGARTARRLRRRRGRRRPAA